MVDSTDPLWLVVATTPNCTVSAVAHDRDLAYYYITYDLLLLTVTGIQENDALLGRCMT